jgi:hypothetical protein
MSPTQLTWQTNFSFYIICTLLTWVAFGMALRIPLILNENLKIYNFITPPGDLAPLNARAGNAIWLILTSAVSALPRCRIGADIPESVVDRYSPIRDQGLPKAQARERLPRRPNKEYRDGSSSEILGVVTSDDSGNVHDGNGSYLEYNKRMKWYRCRTGHGIYSRKHVNRSRLTEADLWISLCSPPLSN